MLVYVDESGHPHPKDPSQNPAVAAICIQESDCRKLAARLHALKRGILGKENLEVKGRRFLTKRTFRHRPNEVAFVEEFFEMMNNFPMTIFGIIMERPSEVIQQDPGWLPNQFRYLLQRVELLAAEADDMATVLFDGYAAQGGGLVGKFNSYLFRSSEGQSCPHITDAPYFVDSKHTAGIQVADMAASVLRLHEENGLIRARAVNEPLLLAVRRYFRVIQGLSKDLTSPEGDERPGFYRLREHALYPPTQFPGVSRSAEGQPTLSEIPTPEEE